MARWSKKRALAWMEGFIAEHEVVPSSSIRAYYDGPPDSELERHWGGIKQGLQAAGAPLDDARFVGAGLKFGYRYQHSRGVLTDVKGKREREVAAHSIRVICSKCDWDERHPNALEGIVSQRLHLRDEHGIEPRDRKTRQRWKNPPSSD